MNVGCPTCGADVEFRYDDSFVRVCGSCRSAVLRSDRGIETLGQLADLVPIESPLRLFAEGKYREVSFLLVGMAQIKHAAGGIWQEWYAKLDGGQWAWVSEAQGRFYITFERVGVALPRFEELRPGVSISISGRWFSVGELGEATYASASGEIPYRLDPAATFRFADLADGQGGFATIDYNDGSEAPALYVGHQATLGELGIFGGEVADAAAPRRQQGAKLACPNCGGSLELHAPDQTLRVACPFCNHLVSVQSGNLSVIAKLAHKATPRIALGSKGTFKDGELTVIGYVERSALIDGTWYAFEEYLLYAAAVGFRWLVCSDGHWSYVQPVAPGAVELMPIRYDGVPFTLFQRADLRVDEVLGEFYWQVTAGERVVAEDYIAPPAMLSCETSRTEQSWSLSTYLTRREVVEAFKQKELPLPTPVGVGANQPYPLHGIGKVAAIIGTLLCVAGIARCRTAGDEARHTEQFEIAPTAPRFEDAPPPAAEGEVPANVKFSQPFHLDAGKNIEVQLRAPLSNTWMYAAIDLVNEATGSVVSFDANLEYYAGYEDGESWSEGSDNGSQVLGPMDSGSYVLRVEGQQGSATPLPLSLTVRQDVFRGRWWLIAAGVLFLPFGLIGWHAYRFKKKRWENSQLVRSSEPIGSGSSSSYTDFTAWETDDDD